MAYQAKGESEGSSGSAKGAADPESSVTECIRVIASYNARADLTTEHQMTLFLKSWWSSTYNRPLKDPLLESYSLEELLYEFYDKLERQKAAEERIASDADKIEEAKEKEVLDWAEQEEQKELQELEAMQSAAAQQIVDPAKDPKNIEWMQEQLKQAKETYGETFGEDIEASFEEE